MALAFGFLGTPLGASVVLSFIDSLLVFLLFLFARGNGSLADLLIGIFLVFTFVAAFVLNVLVLGIIYLVRKSRGDIRLFWWFLGLNVVTIIALSASSIIESLR